MPELVIPVGENIGPGFIDWDEYDYVPGFTVDNIKMQIEWANYQGQEVDSILLQFGICYGGSVRHAMDVYNYLQSLKLPIRAHIMSLCASSGTIVALAADAVEMEHTAQWMTHRPLFPEGTYSQRSEGLRADADRLDREEQAIRDIYMARTGKPEADVVALMSTDRFMTAQEAKDFGFATKVIPLKSKAPSGAEAQARLSQFKLAVARVNRRATQARFKPAPKAAFPKPTNSQRPMAEKAKKTAPKAGAKKAAPTAQQKANALLVANLAKQLGVKATIEGAEEEPVAEVQSTETDQDGALLYHDGPLAQGVAVFYDEALTEAAEDGTYGLADGRSITVAGGVVETITDAESEDEAENTTEDSTNLSEVMNRLKQLEDGRKQDEETIASLQTELKKFKGTVPPTPSATGRRPAPQVDPKNSGKPKPKAAHHGTM
ncbi:Clp protease ClpP [Hymenobacter sp. HSC-4F20]|uniref:Clp protease ClpP n=1 Tax=Hymenobacter sp. HSC-4F20 TaxID=2864135 RepID=UPI001C73BA9E|nr:Clp protease ClpP [Hymenobacter sp. HSC-4F20]MBX0290959.1 Clp protease ClpP [Hymenobacter sp. HSC-4F20]